MLELQRVPNEKDRRIVAHHVIDALARIKLQSEAARIAPGVGTTLLTGHRGEADQGLGLGARLEDGGPRIAAHVLSDLKMPEGTAALGMRLTFRDAFAIEVRHLLDQIMIVEHDGTIRTDRK